MSDLLAARSQMALSLGFHIVFAAISIAMPMMMALAEWRWRRTQRPEYLLLAKRWATGTAILFAIGGVSGTVLSFELGLLWPTFMGWAGGAIGLLFSLEGFAFLPKRSSSESISTDGIACAPVFICCVPSWLRSAASPPPSSSSRRTGG